MKIKEQTLGGRSEFFWNLQLSIEYGEGSKGELSFADLEEVFWRYVEVEISKRGEPSQYTDPIWPKTPNRVLSPYAAVLVRDFFRSIDSGSKEDTRADVLWPLFLNWLITRFIVRTSEDSKRPDEVQ